MHVLMGTVKKGSIEVNQPVSAEDGTSVIIFVMPRIIETNSTSSLFGKWDWYTDETEKDIHHAWQRFGLRTG